MSAIAIGPGPIEATARGNVYLPIIGTGPAGPPPPFDDPQAAAFFSLLTTDPRQQRPALTVCPSLMLAARRRAAIAATSDVLSHCDQYGLCPNAYAAAAGCRLPAHYPTNGNSIESLAAGSPDAGVIFAALANSPSHARHLFGEGEFFRAQRDVGIAVVEVVGSRWRWYWSILIGECGQVSGE